MKPCKLLYAPLLVFLTFQAHAEEFQSKRISSGEKSYRVTARAGYMPLFGYGAEASYRILDWYHLGLDFGTSTTERSRDLDEKLGSTFFGEFYSDKAHLDSKHIFINQRAYPFLETLPSLNFALGIGYHSTQLDYSVSKPRTFLRDGKFQSQSEGAAHGDIRYENISTRLSIGNIWKIKNSWLLGADWIGYNLPLFSLKENSQTIDGDIDAHRIAAAGDKLVRENGGARSVVGLLLYAGVMF